MIYHSDPSITEIRSFRFKGFTPNQIYEGFPELRKSVACVLDTETTGLDPKSDEIVELGMRLVYLDKVIQIGESFSQLQEPGKPMPAEATAINGITDEDLKGQSINWIEAQEFLDRADFVVAHNAKFDREFCEAHGLKHPRWVCSREDIDWKSLGHTCRHLEHLCRDFFFFYSSHRALMDVDALIRLLCQSPMGEVNWSRLLEVAKDSKHMVTAKFSSFEDKDKLKAQGFFWDPSLRQWKKAIRGRDLEATKAWMTQEIYKANQFLGIVEEITPAMEE